MMLPRLVLDALAFAAIVALAGYTAIQLLGAV